MPIGSRPSMRRLYVSGDGAIVCKERILSYRQVTPISSNFSSVEATHLPDQQHQHFGNVDQALEAQCARIARHLCAGNTDLDHGASAAQQLGEDLALEGEAGAIDAQLLQQIDAVDRKAVVVLDLLSE